MTTPAPPQLGFTYPAPRTWASGDIHTAARWRADMTNLGYLFAGKCRPMLLSFNTDQQALSSGSRLLLFIGPNVPLNTWSVVVQNQSTPSSVSAYQIPFGGYYLLEGAVSFTTAGTPANAKYTMGFQWVQNGSSAINGDGGSTPATNSTGTITGSAGLELVQFNTYAATSDTAAIYGFTSNGSPGHVANAHLMIEWVGLPTSGLTSYAGSYGTVVAAPQPAAAPPSGQGTTLANSYLAGATSVTVNDVTGIIAGGTIGLDYLNGQLNTLQAEAVTVSSVSGATVGVSALAFPHSAGAPVSVPLSAAFMNQQLRDIVNFLSYPPMSRAVSNSTQSLSSQSFPAGTQITTLGTSNIDTFNGFSSNTYTAPVAGTYLCYGQVYLAGSTSSFRCAAGLSVNSGTINWGVRCASVSTSANTTCPTVRRVLRLNAGDTVTLYGTQDSGSGMNTVSSGAAFSKLIILWRSV